MCSSNPAQFCEVRSGSAKRRRREPRPTRAIFLRSCWTRAGEYRQPTVAVKTALHADCGAGRPLLEWGGQPRRSGRVISAGAERVTAENAAEAFPGSPSRAIFPHRLNHVVAARRFVAADRAQPGADEQLVGADRSDERILRELPKHCSEAFHAICIVQGSDSFFPIAYSLRPSAYSLLGP